MLYLISYLVMVCFQVLLPALGLWLLCVVGALLIWRFLLRRQKLQLLILLSLIPPAILAVHQYRPLQERFTHTELYNYKAFVADPIGPDIRDLAMAVGSPEMFHDGALVRFRAESRTLQGLLDHSISGSRFPMWLERLRGASGGDIHVIWGEPVSLAYRRITPAEASALSAAYGWVGYIATQWAARPELEMYALILEGPGGRLKSMLAANPATGDIEIRQHFDRAPRPEMPKKK